MKKKILSVLLSALMLISILPVTIASANVIGDVDGDGAVKAADARLALRASVGLETFTDAQIAAADVDFDGAIKAADARMILRASVGLEILVDPHTHSYKEAVTKAATCTEKGVKTFTCDCGDSYTEDIAATGHTAVTDKAAAPTCTTAGKTEGSHCSVCNAVLTAQTAVPATGHKNIALDKSTVVAATCNKDGYSGDYKCGICGTVTTKGKTIPSAGTSHKNITLDKSTVVAVTCKTDGYSGDYKCGVCGTVTTKGKTVSSTGTEHILGDVTVKATCNEDGYSVTKCKYCSYYVEASLKAGEKAQGHKYGTPKTVAPTCTEQGYTLETCTVCGADSRSNYTDAKGHTYKWKTSLKATCKTTGSRTGTCSVCKDTTTQIIPLTACTDIEETFVAGSGADPCKQVVQCNTCKKKVSEREFHKMQAVGVPTAASCTEHSTVDKKCLYCDYTEEDVVVSKALGHLATVDTANSREVTCTVDGKLVYSGTCQREGCGEELDNTEVIIKATGHAPTGTQTCTTAVTCTRCSDVLAAALGHDHKLASIAYGVEVDTFFCERCGKETDNKLATFNTVANRIKNSSFAPTYAGNRSLYYIDKSSVTTSYSRFDFGIYTSAIRDLYEDEMANTPDEYTPVRYGGIRTSLPLYNDRTTVSLLTSSDIDGITVEKLSGIKISDVLSAYPTTYTVGTRNIDLSKYKSVDVKEDVIKVTIDVKNEKYTTVKNLQDDQLTSLQKIFDLDIRAEADEFRNDKGELRLTETEKGEGYEISMTMELREITSDAKVTYYFRASTYEPIIALYEAYETMDQTIDMTFKIGLFSLNGELDPVITTHQTRVYLFPNYFAD